MDHPIAASHSLAEIDRERMTAVCSTCGFTSIYFSRQLSIVVCEKEAENLNLWGKGNNRIIREYIQKHKCKRCGVWGLGLEKDFKFFELHLTLDRKIKRLARTIEPDELKLELEKRDLYCKKCYWYAEREYKQDIPIPPVKPLSTYF
jgi:hypothetical protein